MRVFFIGGNPFLVKLAPWPDFGRTALVTAALDGDDLCQMNELFSEGRVYGDGVSG
jgi:hypothetical protein